MTVKVEHEFYSDGTVDKVWKNKNGKYHREDGPALEYSNGVRIWYKNNRWHREDGPACIYSDGKFEYYLFNKSFSKEEYLVEIEKIKEERKRKK